MAYPGGKSGAGVYQTIINLMPPHPVYIEPFLGGGAIMRLKRRAALNIGVDLDGAVIRQWRASIAGNGEAAAAIAENGDARSTFRFRRGDGIAFLAAYPFTGAELVYCDPPYMHETRGRRDLYRHEMTDRQHAELLEVIAALPCRVIVSGYWTRHYAKALKQWNTASFQAITRGGRPATEWLWFNFPEPVALHDYRYLGQDFRARERIKRKKHRWVNRLQKMPTLERRALLCAIRRGLAAGTGRNDDGSFPRNTRGKLPPAASPGTAIGRATVSRERRQPAAAVLASFDRAPAASPNPAIG